MLFTARDHQWEANTNFFKDSYLGSVFTVKGSTGLGDDYMSSSPTRGKDLGEPQLPQDPSLSDLTL